MNTQTTTRFNNPFTEEHGIEVFNQVIAAFRAKAKTTGLSAVEHILYNMVRNLPLNRGFTPITNQVKLANGQYPEQRFDIAKASLKYVLNKNFAAYVKTFSLPVETHDYWLNKLV